MAEVNSFARFFGATYPVKEVVLDGTPTYGDAINILNGEYTGGGGVTPNYPAESEVLLDVEFGNVGDEPFVGNYHEVDADAVFDNPAIKWGPDRAYSGTLTVPPVADVRDGVAYGYQSSFVGILDINTESNLPAESDVLVTITYGSDPVLTGQWRPVSPENARLGLSYGPAGTPVIGSLDIDEEANLPKNDQVLVDITYGENLDQVGELDPGASGVVPKSTDVRFGTPVGDTQGSMYIPTADQVLYGIAVDQTVGTVTLPAEIVTLDGISYGANGELNGRWHTAEASNYKLGETYGVDGQSSEGTYDPGGGGVIPDVRDVRIGVQVGEAPAVGVLTVPIESDVRLGTAYDAYLERTGTLDPNAGSGSRPSIDGEAVPAVWNQNLTQGDDYNAANSYSFEWEFTGGNIDFNNASGTFLARDGFGNRFDGQVGLAVSEGKNIITLTIQRSELSIPGYWYHDLEIVDNLNNTVITVLRGVIQVVSSVTDLVP